MQEVLREAAVDVLDNADLGDDLSTFVGELTPDVIVVPTEAGELPSGVRELLDRRADLTVLGLLEHGRRGVLWELRPVRRELGVLTKRRFVEVLEAAGRT